MDRETLARRYRYLWSGESAAIVIFVVLFLVYARPAGAWPKWIARTLGLALLIMIQLQGVIWWRWKLRTLRAGRRAVPASVLKWFHHCKWVNWLLLSLFPLVLWLKWRFGNQLWTDGDTWLGLGLTAVAVLEQVNYYYYQLMYDGRYDWRQLRAQRRLRPGSIGKVLAHWSRTQDVHSRDKTRLPQLTGAISTWEWKPLPHAGCVNVSVKPLLSLDQLAVSMLRFEENGTIHEHASDLTNDVICLEGSGFISVGNQQWPITAGDHVRWPAGQRHCLWTTDVKMITLMLEHNQ